MSHPGYRQIFFRLGFALLCCSLALFACQAAPAQPASVPAPGVTQDVTRATAAIVAVQTVDAVAALPIRLPASAMIVNQMSVTTKLTVRPPALTPTRKPVAPNKPTVRPLASTPTRKPAAPKKKIVLVGHLQHSLPSLARYLHDSAGYNVSVNTKVSPADLVLIVVSAVDGPMPQTRQAIERMDGQTAAHAAILLTRTDQMDDPELQQLVLLEIREMLTLFIGYEQAEALPVLLSPNPGLIPDLRALLARPEAPVEFALPAADHQPILNNVYVSEDESSGRLVLNQFIDFVDDDGDVNAVEFEVVSSDLGTIEGSYGPIDTPATEQQSGTTALVPWDCGGEVYTATLSATLLDSMGNRSNSIEYPITCF